MHLIFRQRSLVRGIRDNIGFYYVRIFDKFYFFLEFQVINVNIDTNPDDIKIGDYVLVEHGRWSRRFSGPDIDHYSIVEEKAVLLVSEDAPIV